MANHALPTTGSTYANFVTELQARIDDAVKENSSASVTLTNPPTNLVRWNSTNFYWEINTGTPAAPVWGNRSTRYDININGTVGATTPNTGAFTTLSTSGIASLAANSTVGSVPIVTTTGTQTLTNKTLSSPTIGFIINGTGTLTLPVNISDSIVSRTSTDTLTNKTLTAPKFTSGTALQDANGVNLLAFPASVTGAANYVQVNNSVTAIAPSIVAAGTDANVSLNLTGKGTGVVMAGGIEVVTLTGTQTLTNKTLTDPTIARIYNGGLITIPSGVDTLVNLTGIQTLTNKTLSTGSTWGGNAIPVANGGTGATTASAALTNLGAYSAANPSGFTSNVGTVTGVTATAPVTSSGGTAPVISMAAATSLANGYMTSTYAAKLDGIAAGATNYIHPANHPPSIITQDASNRFVTDTEKATWNAKQAALAAGTTGQVLTYNGSAWAAAAAGSLVNVQVFNASGTYTPTAGVTKIWVEVQGPGAAGSAGNAGYTTGGGGGTVYNTGRGGDGGASGCRRGAFSASPASTAVTVGASGGTSAFGTLITGVGTIASGTGGSVIQAGSYGVHGTGLNQSAYSAGGAGGGVGGGYGSAFGPGGAGGAGGAGAANSGGGGGGGSGANGGGYGWAAGAGGAGGSGQVVIFEYV